MIRRYGIDTTVLVRLLTGDPEDEYVRIVERLSVLVRNEGAEIVASNQVIGEAYLAVRHHYGVDRADARAGLRNVLRSGLVAPLNGFRALVAIEASTPPGLLDRLIADDYTRSRSVVLTLDGDVAGLPGVVLL